MASSLEQTQEQFLADLRAYFARWRVQVVEQSIPNIKTVRRNSVGQIEPYIAVQMGDTQAGYQHSMAGPIGDDYYLPVYMQAVAALPADARKAANRILTACLGKSDFPWGGSMRKRPGGNMFPIVTSDGATEAYQFPSSWSLLIQIDEENP